MSPIVGRWELNRSQSAPRTSSIAALKSPTRTASTASSGHSCTGGNLNSSPPKSTVCGSAADSARAASRSILAIGTTHLLFSTVIAGVHRCTRSAATNPTLVDVRVLACEPVTALALLLSGLLSEKRGTAKHVLSLRYRLEVVWIHASCVATQVVKRKVCRPNQLDVKPPVSKDRPASCFSVRQLEPAIAMAVAERLPLPAVTDVHLFEEPLQRVSRHDATPGSARGSRSGSSTATPRPSPRPPG